MESGWRNCLDSAIPPGPPALRYGGSKALANTAPGATWLLGRPGNLSPGSEYARGQSGSAGAVQLQLGRRGAAPGEVRGGGRAHLRPLTPGGRLPTAAWEATLLAR